MAIDIGLIGYNTYTTEMNGVGVDGIPLPQWSELGKQGQDAWRAAAVAVLRYIDGERARISEDPNDDCVRC
jgi:hypothetical protein